MHGLCRLLECGFTLEIWAFVDELSISLSACWQGALGSHGFVAAGVVTGHMD
jgi:hypothetical protein